MDIKIWHYLLNLYIYLVSEFENDWTQELEVIRVLVTGYFIIAFMLSS